jgi:hypothetical protein
MSLHVSTLGIRRAVSRVLSTATISVLLLLASPPSARADTTVCGTIQEDTTWTVEGNNYIVTCMVHVIQHVTLTIEPGVRVYFDPGTQLRIDGELIAQGVTFTSNDPTPEPGDWMRIFFMETSDDAVFDADGNYVSGSILRDSVVVFGGGGFEGAVMTYGASPYLSGNTITLSASRGIYAQGRSATNKIVIDGNFVSDNNGGGIYVSAGQVVSNTIQGNTASVQGGGIQATDTEIVGNTVLDNSTSSPGGGIYAEGSNISGNTVAGNSAQTNGGGVSAIGGTLQGNYVSGNTLGPSDWEFVCGGGIFASAATLSDNTVAGNQINGGFFTPNTGGGGVCAYLSDLTKNTITNNSAALQTSNTYGGGIYSEGGDVTRNLVSQNSVAGDETGYGGGIFAKGGSLMDNTISDNVAAGSSDSKGGGVYGDISTVRENTLTGNKANQGSAVYAYKGSVTSNIMLTNTTSLSGTLFIDQGTATLNVLRANSAVAGGAIYGTGATLTGNSGEDNTANLGAGIYARDSTVLGNTLSDNHATSHGGGIYAIGGEVTNNTLTGNTVPSWGHGSGAYILGVTDFTYNSVLTNTATGGTSGGVSIGGQPVMQYNNLYGNQPYDAEVVSAEDVTGTLNYWGLSACTGIPAQIYDGNDAPGRGKLTYAPSLYLFAPVAQLAAPENLVLTEGQNSVTLDWSPIPAIPPVGCRVPGSSNPDVVYRVYYDAHDACGPYNGKGLPVGDSPITVGAETQITLPGASQDGFVFVVSALDFLGRESAFSNSVGNPSEGWQVFLAALLR